MEYQKWKIKMKYQEWKIKNGISKMSNQILTEYGNCMNFLLMFSNPNSQNGRCLVVTKLLPNLKYGHWYFSRLAVCMSHQYFCFLLVHLLAKGNTKVVLPDRGV